MRVYTRRATKGGYGKEASTSEHAGLILGGEDSEWRGNVHTRPEVDEEGKPGGAQGTERSGRKGTKKHGTAERREENARRDIAQEEKGGQIEVDTPKGHFRLIKSITLHAEGKIQK